MNRLIPSLGLTLALLLTASLPAQEPAAARRAILRIEAGGPTAVVTSLAFGPGGKTLYAAGYDKVVRAWKRDEKNDYVLQSIYRLPIGPGAGGVINAMALSPDGRWLAAAGMGVMREESGFRDIGIIEPRAGRQTDEMLRDQGAIYLFDTTRKNRPPRAMRGHRGIVFSMTVAPAARGKPPLLVSMANESGEAIVRLWDAVEAKLLATSPALPDPRDGRPGLAAWHTGKEAKKLCVALACRDRPLTVWNVSANHQQPLDRRRLFNDTVAVRPADDARSGTLWTGFFQEPGAHLQKWTLNGAEQPGAAAEPILLLEDGAPTALTLLPTGGRAAAVLYMRDNKPYRLVVFDRRGRVQTNVSLWRGSQKPALVASSDGLLAVAGNSRHEILVFGPEAAPDKPMRLKQRIRAEGMLIQQIAFVRGGKGGKERGLRLTEQAPTGAADPRSLVFDFADRSITSATKDWTTRRPAGIDDWRVKELKRKDDSVHGYEVGPPREDTAQILLKPGQSATARALLPRFRPLNIPLLAVAYREGGVACLGLFHAGTGVQLRQYTGHLNTIHSLAFDADGRLLASAAEDKTVCVWSLTDLDQTVGRHGMLAGFAVKQEKEGLRVAELNSAFLSPQNRKALANAKVQPDDSVEMLDKKGARKIASPQAFYEALWQMKPGEENLSLRFRGRAKVLLGVDQGIDDVKPLFSLFVIGGEKPQWIAWNPNGPYDPGPGGTGEGRIGWQVNPNKPGQPVEYSSAAKYRKEYRRDGIVRHLVETGNLADALRAWKDEPVPPPGLSLSINEIAPDHALRDRLGHPVVQTSELTLSAGIYGVPPAKLAGVEWQFDGGERTHLDEDAGHLRTVDLSKLKWTRGLHELRVIVRTVESTPVEHVKTIRVHYMPLPPSIEFSKDWLKEKFGAPMPRELVVMESDFAFKAIAAPSENSPAGRRIKFRVRLNKKNQEKGWKDRDLGREGAEVLGTLRLQPGLNEVDVRAENDGASPDEPPLESAATPPLLVRYDPPVPPTIVTVASVDPAPDPKIDLPDLAEPVVVRVPSVRVRVQISAGEPLTRVTLDGKPAPGFTADGKRKTFVLDQKVTLKPGERKLTFVAAGIRGKAEQRVLRLAYHPKLPQLDPTETRSRQREAGQLDLPLKLRLTELEHRYPFTAAVQINEGKKVMARVSDDNVVTVEVVLRPGNNRIVAILNNKYRQREEEIQIYCKRPPVVQPPVKGPKVLSVAVAAIDLTTRVQTPEELPLLGISIDGREIGRDLWQAKRDKEPQSWTVVVKNVPLRAGKNRLALSARNRDGTSLELLAVDVNYTPPSRPPAPARVEMIEPLTDETVEVPRCKLAFRVWSESPPRVRVLRDGKPLPLVKPTKDGDARVYQFDRIDLEPGPNSLRVEVSNAAGPVKLPDRVISYLRPWFVRIHFNRLERRDTPGTFVPLTEKAPVGNVRLHGEVEWRHADDPGLLARVRLRVWVNGFEQLPASLGLAKDRRRAFAADIRLSARENQIEVRLPAALKLDTDSPVGLKLACDRPEQKQRLHLVIVAPGNREGAELTKSVLSAFLAFNIKKERFQTPAFEEGILHGPLRPDITREGVESFLARLMRRVRPSREGLNDVVVVFFSGEEVVQDKKLYLHTQESRKLGNIKESAIDCDRLREMLGDMKGAKLLLLDVRAKAGSRADAAAEEEAESNHLGFYRYVWLGGADAPAKARLVHALQLSLARASLVRDLNPMLDSWAKDFGKEAMLRFSDPPGLRLLKLGKAGEK